ncbi:maltose O-acetyltransferase [Salinimicrobium catena]|uniref:Acetyltransferase n=1 Tax=Salinimicrobium catena TaxID=390640 RepID=A0A1H5P7E5_9FLAO|nr:sugar O-acetyltransferase [Salinimicrobium catena]SDL75666.1 maltose O-acetyltransferase [Salinimicrobium catena]SEF09873.1 maltose O-acetyltransferase [Salinimicrobium catena]
MTEKEKMLAGKLYLAEDEELKKNNRKAKTLTHLFNQTTEDELAYRTELLKELFKTTGKNLYIEPPFRCDYGCHISIGENFYANYDCIIIDVCKVSIGNNVFFGPRVGLYTAAHPIDAAVRNTLLEFGKPIVIGNNVWIGGNAVINPGVTIGDKTIIGSGSVVTKDIPEGVIAAGNPCKVVREITETDKLFWEEKQREYHQK